MNKVKLSVCIPVYNCGEYLRQAIDSVLSQSFRDFELIILDNQSTDNTVDIVKSYMDPRIRFYQNEVNIGMLANWNKVLTLARGEYIKILPADDYLYPECLKLQCEVLDKDVSERVVLVCGRKNIVNDRGKTLFTRGYSAKEMNVDGFEAINKTIRSGGNIIGEPGVVMFRRSVLTKCGDFDATIYYVMDLYMWFKMLVHGNLYVLPQVVCAFRISTVSESTRIINKQRVDVDNFIRKIYFDGKYKLSKLNYRLGLLNSLLSSIAKKIIYKTVLKGG